MGIKKILRKICSNGIAIVATSMLVEGFKVEMDYYVIGVAAIVLGLVNFFIKPIIKIISFPINAVTLGFFGVVINAALLYLVVYLIDGLEVTSGNFSLDLAGLVIPEIHLSWPWTLGLSAILIGMINWILRKVLL